MAQFLAIFWLHIRLYDERENFKSLLEVAAPLSTSFFVGHHMANVCLPLARNFRAKLLNTFGNRRSKRILYTLKVAKDTILATLCIFLERDTSTFGHKMEKLTTYLLTPKIVGLFLTRSVD